MENLSTLLVTTIEMKFGPIIGMFLAGIYYNKASNLNLEIYYGAPLQIFKCVQQF